MNFKSLAEERYSVRKFSNKPIEKEKLDLVLKAGQLAPTACNYQPQRILVIESQAALEKLKEFTSYHFNASVVLLICYDNTVSCKNSFNGKDVGDKDGSIVTTHMMLQAADIGLGTTWVGYFNPELTIKAFNIPENYVPVALLPIGYPAEDGTPSPMHSKRVPLEETVFYNDFSNLGAKEIG